MVAGGWCAGGAFDQQILQAVGIFACDCTFTFLEVKFAVVMLPSWVKHGGGKAGNDGTCSFTYKHSSGASFRAGCLPMIPYMAADNAAFTASKVVVRHPGKT